MEPEKSSSEHIENKGLTLISETASSKDCFDKKIQAKFDKSDNIFEQPEKELMDFMEKQHQE